MNRFPLRRGELVQSASNEGWTVYVRESDSLHVLNESARAIWELCDGETSPEEMVDAISILTGIPEQQARRDVIATMEDLAASGLVTDWPGNQRD